jgi:sRNA-binding protein
MATVESLAEHWPCAFILHQARPRPLKHGIDQDTIAATPGAFTPDELQAAPRFYCGNLYYFFACREGAERVDLNGEPAGTVSQAEAERPPYTKRNPRPRWCLHEQGPGHARRMAAFRAKHAVFAASGRRVSPGGKAKGSKNMSQEIGKHSTEVENIKVAAQADAGFEKILKFKKGAYFVDEEEIPLGTEYVAHARAWVKCWIKFVDGEVKERKVYRVALGERPPEREDLDDQDQTKWAEGLNGRLADPWVYQYLLPLESLSNGEILIFVSSSFGGRRAVADLCSAYARRTTKIAECGQPIVRLAAADMPTRSSARYRDRTS